MANNKGSYEKTQLIGPTYQAVLSLSFRKLQLRYNLHNCNLGATVISQDQRCNILEHFYICKCNWIYSTPVYLTTQCLSAQRSNNQFYFLAYLR